MAVEQMRKISICALKKHRKTVLERLQALGWVEICLEPEETEAFPRTDTAGARNAFQKRMHLADQALEILDRYAPEKKPMLHSLEGKPLLEGSIYDHVAVNRSEYSRTANTLIQLDQELQTQRTNVQKMKLQIEEMQPWMKLDVPMIRPGTKRCDFFVGTLPAPCTEKEVRSFLSEANETLSLYTIQILSAARDGT